MALVLFGGDGNGPSSERFGDAALARVGGLA
jgi:hypothetical protein